MYLASKKYHPTLEKRNVRYLMDSEIDLCCIIRLADKMIATRFLFSKKNLEISFSIEFISISKGRQTRTFIFNIAQNDFSLIINDQMSI